jgi:hypothetical protein
VIETFIVVSIVLSLAAGLGVAAYEYRRRSIAANAKLDEILAKEREIQRLTIQFSIPAVVPEHERGDS